MSSDVPIAQEASPGVKSKKSATASKSDTKKSLSKSKTNKSGTKSKKEKDKGDESEHERPFEDLYIEDLEDMAVNRLIFGEKKAN